MTHDELLSKDSTPQGDKMLENVEEYRMWDKTNDAIAFALGRWKREALSFDSLENRVKREAFDEFVSWYWGTSRDSAYKGENK